MDPMGNINWLIDCWWRKVVDSLRLFHHLWSCLHLVFYVIYCDPLFFVVPRQFWKRQTFGAQHRMALRDIGLESPSACNKCTTPSVCSLKMTIEIVDFPIENGGSFHSFLYVYPRVLKRVSQCISGSTARCSAVSLKYMLRFLNVWWTVKHG